MPRFYFNVFDGAAAVDAEGMQLTDSEEARRMAIRYASDLLRGEAAKAMLGEEWRVEVADGSGMILIRIDIIVSDAPALGNR